MSKKHKKVQQEASNTPVYATHAAEYRIISHDLLKVVVLNVVYLAALLAVYYADRQKHFLDPFIAHFLHL